MELTELGQARYDAASGRVITACRQCPDFGRVTGLRLPVCAMGVQMDKGFDDSNVHDRCPLPRVAGVKWLARLPGWIKTTGRRERHEQAKTARGPAQGQMGFAL